MEERAEDSSGKRVKTASSVAAFPGGRPSGRPKEMPPETMAWKDGVRTRKPSAPALMSMPLVFQKRVLSVTRER